MDHTIEFFFIVFYLIFFLFVFVLCHDRRPDPPFYVAKSIVPDGLANVALARTLLGLLVFLLESPAEGS